MIEINNRNYDLQISLFCGTDKSAASDSKSNKNATYLMPNNVTKVVIKTSILTPYVEGYFDYDDINAYSYLRQVITAPFIYGHLTFAMVNPSEQPGAVENESYCKAEMFDERIVITGIDSVKVGGIDSRSNFRFTFASIDSINFSATLPPYSTFDKGEEGDSLDTVLKTLFSKAGLAGRFDFSKNVPSIKVPFMTTCNESLHDALEYIYRKAFDVNMMSDNSTNGFFKVIYDHYKKKYVIWRFDAIGNNISDDTPDPTPSNFTYINERRIINCDMSDVEVAGSVGGGKATAEIRFSGNVFDSMTVFADRKYYGYKYVDNNFTDNVKEIKDFWKNNIHDFHKPDKFAVKSSLYEKSQLDKTLKFNVAHSRWRENAGVYDMYNGLIFGSTYIHVNATGIIGRKAGDIVLLKFIEDPTSAYNKFRGDHFITSHSNVYVKNDENYGGVATLRSEMECYSPYIQKESNSESGGFSWM